MPFEARDILEDLDARADMLAANGGLRRVPTIVVGDEVMIGFNRMRVGGLLGIGT